MYVFWVKYFISFHWRQFSKSWTPSFLPYSAPVCEVVLWYFFLLSYDNKRISKYDPACVFLSNITLYYIVNACFFECYIFTDFRWRRFSKSWTPSFLPYPCSVPLLCPCICFVCSTQNIQWQSKDVPTPVCFFLLYYIYSKYMYFWVNYFTSFRWRQFSKSWAPSFLPYPCSCTYFINSRLFVVLQTTHMRVNKVGLPTPVCFFLLYYI